MNQEIKMNAERFGILAKTHLTKKVCSSRFQYSSIFSKYNVWNELSHLGKTHFDSEVSNSVELKK